ncbi:MAG TPA: glycoside hydrolase family 43 protein [Verrucomicrobiae bacterium]
MRFNRLLCGAIAVALTTVVSARLPAANPIITDAFTADPAPLVVGDTVYLYCGQDEAPSPKSAEFVMNRWLCYSSKDMKTWKAEGSPLAPKDFTWAKADAWASQVIERNGKFYWYAPVEHDKSHPGKAIGVAVSDKPTGPFKDARGSALITNDMTPEFKSDHDDIDPTVWIDDDGQAWLYWGNHRCYYAKLKANMIELDGEIHTVPLDQIPDFREAPWIHKRNGIYYLSYAVGMPEKIAYSTAEKITGPWTYRGLLAEGASNSFTIHQGIITFKGVDYFVYHNGSMQQGTKLDSGNGFRRSVCVDYLYYNADGSIKRVVQTTEGTDLPPQK